MRGFSILETVLIVTLTGLLGLAALDLFLGSLAAARWTDAELRAHHICEDYLQVARGQAFRAYALDETVELPLKVSEGIEYRSRLHCSRVSGENPAFLKRLSVQVRWASNNKARSTEQHAYVAKLAP